MPPARTKNPTAPTSSSESIPAFPAPPTMVPTKGPEDQHVSTPQKSSARSVSITQAQKQALIDNLQLEITERARKLRSQYALQAQGLRSRLEMRVNRIPQGLRKRNIQELLDEHIERSKPAPRPPMPVASTSTSTATNARQKLKRTSDQISTDGDKENEPAASTQPDLANPKKRAKTATTATKPGRVVSKTTAGGVLSPKSQNSRAAPPRSPVKASALAEKSTIPKPSPVKAAAKAVKAAITRTGTRKRGPVADDKARTSEGSDTSNGTTVISRATTKKTAAATAKKPAAAKTTTSTARKAPAPKKETAAPARTAGGRTLRNRG